MRNNVEKAEKTKKQIAYEGIKKMIVAGELSKDMVLVERQLCEKLQVSRTPIREALRELANEGLVEVVDGKGVFIKKIEIRDMIEIFELREALESMAVRLFVERKDEKMIQKLREYLEQQKIALEKGDHVDFMNTDMKIHRLISAGAKNNRLENIINSIYDQITRLAISAKDDTQLRNVAINAHEKLLEAIEAGDVKKAQEIMVEHVVDIKKYHMERYYLL